MTPVATSTRPISITVANTTYAWSTVAHVHDPGSMIHWPTMQRYSTIVTFSVAPSHSSDTDRPTRDLLIMQSTKHRGVRLQSSTACHVQYQWYRISTGDTQLLHLRDRSSHHGCNSRVPSISSSMVCFFL